MSCEELRDKLARLEFKLPEQSSDRALVVSMNEKLEVECIKLPSSYTATVGRAMVNAGLDDDRVEDIQREVHGRFVNGAKSLLLRHGKIEPEH